MYFHHISEGDWSIAKLFIEETLYIDEIAPMLIHIHIWKASNLVSATYSVTLQIKHFIIFLSLVPDSFNQWTWVSWCQNVSILDFIGAKDEGGGGYKWNYNSCKVSVKSLSPTNQHPAFYRSDVLSPNQQCQSTEGRCKLEFQYMQSSSQITTIRIPTFSFLQTSCPSCHPINSRRYRVMQDLSVLWHCWLGDTKGIRPVKSWMLVCWWWWFDWSFARLIAPVVQLSPLPPSSFASINTG